MKSAIMALGFLTVAAQPSAAAPASGTEAQKAELTQCVVMRTSGADRTLTAQWMFAAMSKSPHIASLSAVSDQRRTELNKAFAQLLTRLVIKDCLEQVRPLAVANLEESFEVVGRALGEVAMQELMGNPDVDKAIGAYADFLSENEFKPLIDSLEKAQSK
jgi:hypothetical protein